MPTTKEKISPETVGIALLHAIQNENTIKSDDERLKFINRLPNEHDKQVIELAMLFLRCFTVDFAVAMNIENTKIKDAVLDSYYLHLKNCLVEMANGGEELYNAFMECVLKYTAALKTNHFQGPVYMIGKKFVELCGCTDPSKGSLDLAIVGGLVFTNTKIWVDEFLKSIEIDPNKRMDKTNADVNNENIEKESGAKNKTEISAKEPIPSVSQTRPWVRFWARAFDYWLFGALVSPFLMMYYSSMPGVNTKTANFALINVFLWNFIEAFLISNFGATPGKWLLKVELRKSSGLKPTYSEALQRAFSVWWRGVAIGMPFINWFTLKRAYDLLKKNGRTSWDSDYGFSVSHKDIGVLRKLVVVLFFVSMIYLSYLGLKGGP